MRGQAPGLRDGTIRFYLRVNALLEPDFTVVDFGCGRGFYGENPVPIRRDLQIFKGRSNTSSAWTWTRPRERPTSTSST